ncbi:MAG: type III secretion system chaperone [Verrucomicrobia bacterium]|nr:type III secretion system chaperone [Verrucomicrobiota bacterium]
MDSENVKRLYKRLLVTPAARGTVGRFDVEFQYMPTKGELFCATAVFYGGNYIPLSVRQAVQSTGLFAASGSSEVRLFIDEIDYQVVLAYRSAWAVGDAEAFERILLDFLDLAEEWRRLLDEYGDQDLIRVPKPK